MEDSKYKDKYLKYKNKYLELKRVLRGGTQEVSPGLFRQKLEQLYPSVVFDKGDKSKTLQSHPENNTTYGEMNYEGLNILNSKFNSSNSIDTFIDIGSGRGKLVLWYAVEPNITKSIGIELVEERHKDAEELKLKLASPEITSKVEFINEDFMKIDFSRLIKPNSKVLIWLSNLCFNPSVTNKIFEKVVREFPKGTIICCSKQTDVSNVKKLDELTIPMSWSSNSTVYVYQT